MRESDWRTRMARLAATEHGADWVINTDADEFWMPRRGTLKEALAAVPDAYGVVWAITRHFVPRPDDGASFAERMTVRLSATAPLNDPTSPYRPHSKAAHRPDPNIVVLFGSHDVVSSALVPFHGWYPVDVLHFPFRSREQYERKGTRRAHGDKPLGQYVKAYEASEKGQIEDVFGRLTVDDRALERGRAAGCLGAAPQPDSPHPRRPAHAGPRGDRMAGPPRRVTPRPDRSGRPPLPTDVYRRVPGPGPDRGARRGVGRTGRRRRFRDRGRGRIGRGPGAVQTRRPCARAARARGRRADASGAPGGDRAGRRLGHRRGCGRVLVAARREPEGRARADPPALHDRPGAPPRLRRLIRRQRLRGTAHDTSLVRARRARQRRAAAAAASRLSCRPGRRGRRPRDRARPERPAARVVPDRGAPAFR